MFSRFVTYICQKSSRHPSVCLIAALLLCIPAGLQINRIRIDTNPVRLLPEDARSVLLTEALEPMVGERSFFYLLFEGNDPRKLVEAVEKIAGDLEHLNGIKSFTYRHPVPFYRKYRFLLLSSDQLENILYRVVQWKSVINPFTLNLLDTPKPQEGHSERERTRDLENLMHTYSDLPEYHQSTDGKTIGILVFPAVGLNDINAAKHLHDRLADKLGQVSDQFGIWAGIGGSLTRWVKGLDVIHQDLKRSGAIMFFSILMVLTLSFGSIRIIPILIFPLTIGLLWTLGIIPIIVGDLNTITSFFLLVSFGLGIDFSIHLVRRFQRELKNHSVEHALFQTFCTTGKSVMLSGSSTAIALFVLTLSDFRGISEFGIVGGSALLLVLLATLLFMPATLIVGIRYKMIPAGVRTPRWVYIPGRIPTLSLLSGVILLGSIGVANLKFDYDFVKLGATITESDTINQKQSRVYKKILPPAAVYATDSLDSLDRIIEIIHKQKASTSDSIIGDIRSIRELCPDREETQKRLRIIQTIKQQIRGQWVDYLEDPGIKNWIRQMQQWRLPETAPRAEEIPHVMKPLFMGGEHLDKYLVTLYLKTDRRQGRNAMAFTRELYGLPVPANMVGPVGETTIVAEILWLVTREGIWLVLATLTGVLVLIYLNQRSLIAAFWILSPLIAGMLLAAGGMFLFGLKINFYNIVVFPALLGMGVDYGIHYFRHWQERQGNTVSTQTTLFEPLSLSMTTTMLGYGGLIFARHTGLHSIGTMAVLGLGCIWISSLLLFPGVLSIFGPQKRFEPTACIVPDGNDKNG